MAPKFAGPAVSAFQKKIRGEETELHDHICKEMNALNLERCRCIPKEQPGADWRVLQTIVEEDPSREKFQVSHSQHFPTIMLLAAESMRLSAYGADSNIEKKSSLVSLVHGSL